MEFQKKQELDFKTIVFRVIDSLSQKALVEYRGGEKRTIIKGDWSETTITEDSRKCFIQGVEFLSDLLIPEFDKQTLEKYEDINKRLKELLEKINQKEIEKEDYILQKLELMREMLRMIMFRLKTTGYLKRQSVTG